MESIPEPSPLTKLHALCIVRKGTNLVLDWKMIGVELERRRRAKRDAF